MMPSPKVQLAIVVIGAVAAIVKLWLQHRATMELRAAEAAAREKLAQEQADKAEQIARHAREAAERAADREQKEKLIEELQASNRRTLDFLEAQLKAHSEAGAQRYAIIEKNTIALSELAKAVGAQAAEFRLLERDVAEIKGGAGCRAPAGRTA